MKKFLKKCVAGVLALVMTGATMVFVPIVPVVVYAGETSDVIVNETQNTIAIRRNIIAASGSTSYVIFEDGSLWAWGDNRFGQVGDGTTEDRYSPVHIMDDVVSVFAGSLGVLGYAMAIRSDGSLWAWGRNHHGQLGDGTRIDRHSPVRIMDGVIDVFIDGINATFVKYDGSMWVTGFLARQNLPLRVMDEVVSATITGVGIRRAIKTDGNLWAWGTNMGGFGDGARNNSELPVLILEDVVYVVDALNTTMAIRGDASLWAWGSQSRGLGDGNTGSRPQLYPIWIMDNVAFVSHGNSHSAAIRTDGSLWTWHIGYGNSGIREVGRIDMSTPYFVGISEHGAILRNTDRTSPYYFSLYEVNRIVRNPARVDIGNAVAVAVGGAHTIAILEDGSLWAWGNNWHGQLGDGTTTPQSLPIHIMDGVMLPSVFYLPVDTIPATPSANNPLFITFGGRRISTTLGSLNSERLDLQSGITNEDIAQLRYMVNLSVLNLHNLVYVTDISPLAYLTNLNGIALTGHASGGRITDISPLAQLPYLVWLVLENQPIEDWSPVRHINNVVGRP